MFGESGLSVFVTFIEMIDSNFSTRQCNLCCQNNVMVVVSYECKFPLYAQTYYRKKHSLDECEGFQRYLSCKCHFMLLTIRVCSDRVVAPNEKQC